ncbi:hypothetical protein SAMN04487775_11231 [Treponema bryantii]|uniref:Major surface protein n=1 Tax=Treponema bryantii TaxID=163 RepID=A0A1I3N4H1_9SPIR|nr:hypothetical protein [Treponema bryantii]SFJ04193.1 hypothetical protein SAMN04487775_11231 [Treponema bryantii]
MKKIVALGAAAALIGGLFAAEPASNPSLVSFTGNASVEWGVDLDAGKTGFKNGTWTEFKIKLFDAGDKALTGDGVWAELVMKVDDDSSVGPNGFVDGGWLGGKNAYIDVAKLHFNNIYVGIKSGDTQTGELDFTTAIHSADPYFHPGRWLNNVGPSSFTQGIVAGYADDNMDIGVDFRSYENGQYTNAYAVAGEFKIKDSNSFAEGLSVGLGASYNLSDTYYKDSTTNTAAEKVENFAYTFGYKINDKETLFGAQHLLGYSASVGYKIKIDDKYWAKPQVGLTGLLATYKDTDNGVTVDASANTNTLAAGAIFAWGDTAAYGSTGGVYFFGDDARGFTPGVSAMVYVPLASTISAKATGNGQSASVKITSHDALKALIVPSFYTGDLVENLSAAVYSEIGLYDYRETQPTPTHSGNDWAVESYGQTTDGKNTMALAVAGGLKYDIKADDITITPKASFRYANTCYVQNKTNEVAPAKDQSLFKDLGEQKTETSGDRLGLYVGDFFNLEAGVDVAGLINNTTFYAHYKSANLLNSIDYSENKDAEGNSLKYYNVKLGTFNVGCKIAF